MKVAKLLLVVLIALFASNIYAQNYHLIYETSDHLYVTNTKNSDNTITPHASFEKGYVHILTFKDKKSIKFQEDTISFQKADSLKNKSLGEIFNIVNKKKNTSQTVSGFYNERSGITVIQSYDKKEWRIIDPLSKPELNERKKWLVESYKKAYLEQNDTLPEWKAPEYTYTEKTKVISGYKCKNLVIKLENWELNTWYTEEISFNWCFEDYKNLIPGTIVQIERDNKIFLKLLSIEELDYDILPIREEVIDKLRKLR